MKRWIFSSSLLLLYCLPMGSCSKYTVTTSHRNPADVIYKKTIAKSFLWGIINKPHTITDTTCGRAGLSEVKVSSNIGYSLLHVISLGTVHLVKIECKCQKEGPVIGQ